MTAKVYKFRKYWQSLHLTYCNCCLWWPTLRLIWFILLLFPSFVCWSHPEATCLHLQPLTLSPASCLSQLPCICPFPRYLISVLQCSLCCHCNLTPRLKSPWYHSFSHKPVLMCPISLLVHMFLPPPPPSSVALLFYSPIISCWNTRLANKRKAKMHPFAEALCQICYTLYWAACSVLSTMFLYHFPYS